MEKDNTNRVLALARFSAIGDVAMCVPAIYSLCRNYKHLRVVMVTRPALTKIFVNAPQNLTVLGADVDKEYAGIGGLRALAARLRNEYGVTDYVDLHNVLRTRVLGLWLRLCHVRVTTMQKDRAGRKALIRPKNKIMVPLISSRARYRMALDAAGWPVTPDFDGLYGKLPAPASLFAHVCPPPVQNEIWVGIAPFAAHKAKIYPPELMSKVVDMLMANENIKVFCFGGGGQEKEILDKWAADHCARVISLAGRKLGFATELAIMSHLKAMVSMDSGNMHLASLVGVPVVSVWGGTHAFAGFEGWRQKPDLRVELSLPCRPCSIFGNKPCLRGDYLCMTAIEPHTIANKVLALLKAQCV